MARRFAGRRKRPRVAWMPTFGGAPIDDPEWLAGPWAGVQASLDLIQDDTIEDGVVWNAFPLTFDQTQEATASQAAPTDRTLRDIVQGNEWRLRRIVGKAFISTNHTAVGSTLPPLIDVALGFIVCNTYDDGAPLTDFNEVNPLTQDSMEDPWIWRRRWILCPQVAAPADNSRNDPRQWGFPTANVSYGSVADGPHIDAKTARVIHRSERLFVVLAARRYVGDHIDINPETQFQDVGVELLLDYRILGSLRGSSYGNRGNAAR